MCPLHTLTLRQIVTKHDSSAAFASCKIANENIHVMPFRTNPRQPKSCSPSTTTYSLGRGQVAVAQPHLCHLQLQTQHQQLLQLPHLPRPNPDLLTKLRVVARTVLPWRLLKVCNSLSYRYPLDIKMHTAFGAATISPWSSSSKVEHAQKLPLPNHDAYSQWLAFINQIHIMPRCLVPNTKMESFDKHMHAQKDWPYTRMPMPESIEALRQQVRWTLMLDVDAQGIWAVYGQGKGHTDPYHARVWPGVWDQMPLLSVLGLIVLDALAVTTCLLTLSVTFTMLYAKSALHYLMTLQRADVPHMLQLCRSRIQTLLTVNENDHDLRYSFCVIRHAAQLCMVYLALYLTPRSETLSHHQINDGSYAHIGNPALWMYGTCAGIVILMFISEIIMLVLNDVQDTEVVTVIPSIRG